VVHPDGYVELRDRLKDVIISGGENIATIEVEQALAAHPSVSEVAVVAAPDPRLGEHGCAFVATIPGNSPPTLQEVRSHFERAGIAKQKWPEELRVVDDFPRTGSGKIRKVDLRRHLLDAGRSPASASGSATGWS
jgi:non-ribosomal peptide synthetase component E (peptide arylation enzyme)